MFTKSTHILLQSLPEEWDDVDGLCNDLKEAFSHSISGLHEVHVWCLVPNKIYATLHITFKDEDSYITAISGIHAFLLKYGINNATIQPEFSDTKNLRSELKRSLPGCDSKNGCTKNDIHEHQGHNQTNLNISVPDILLHNSCCSLPCRQESCSKKQCCVSKEDHPRRSTLQ